MTVCRRQESVRFLPRAAPPPRALTRGLPPPINKYLLTYLLPPAVLARRRRFFFFFFGAHWRGLTTTGGVVEADPMPSPPRPPAPPRRHARDGSDNRVDPRAGRLGLGLGAHQERAPPARRRVRLAGCAEQPGHLQRRCQVCPPRPPTLARLPRLPAYDARRRAPECLHGWTWRRFRWRWAT